jgi:hypothetical protein
MDVTTATEIMNVLETLHPRMTSDGYKMSKPLGLIFVALGGLGHGVHGRYDPSKRTVTVAGLESVSADHVTDTLIHEYTHGVMDAAFHQCKNLRSTGGHCSHFLAMLKTIIGEYKAATA